MLLAALLHDLGHYPLAHDLEDVDLATFDHEDFGAALVAGRQGSSPFPFESVGTDEEHSASVGPSRSTSGNSGVVEERAIRRQQGGDSIWDDIKGGWAVDRDVLVRVLMRGGRPQQLSFKERLMRSIISGPIDADKIDYIRRDAWHLALPYGEAIDFQRLTRCITVTFSTTQQVPILGIVEKGRVTGEAIGFARYAMFAAAYWHNTSRAIKAMIHYVTLSAMQAYAREGRSLRDSLSRYVFTGVIESQFDLWKSSDSELPGGSQAGGPEVLMITWLGEQSQAWKAQGLARMLRNRDLYKRLLEFHPDEVGRESTKQSAREVDQAVGAGGGKQEGVRVGRCRRLAKEEGRSEGDN